MKVVFKSSSDFLVALDCQKVQVERCLDDCDKFCLKGYSAVGSSVLLDGLSLADANSLLYKIVGDNMVDLTILKLQTNNCQE